MRGQRTGECRRAGLRSSGFTLMELLVTIAIIAMLAGILLPALNSAFKKAEEAQARQEVKALETGIKAYYGEYSKFPEASGEEGDWKYGDFSGADEPSNSKLMNALRSVDGPGNSSGTNNPRKLIFLELSEKSMVNSAFVDPWLKEYRICLDTDFDNECENSVSNVLGRNVIVWSAGPDEADGTDDDIMSWK